MKQISFEKSLNSEKIKYRVQGSAEARGRSFNSWKVDRWTKFQEKIEIKFFIMVEYNVSNT